MIRTATDSEGAATKLTHARIGVFGCTGRVGQLLVKELQSGHWEGLSLAGGSVRPGLPANEDFYTTDHPEKLFERADVLVDFTTPDATAKHVWLAAKHHKPIVIGTTGLNAAQEKELRDAAKECAIVYAANMSVGVNLLLALVEQAAARLPGWDIQIAETHHRHKKDAPSGTALALGRATGEDNIGYAVQRGGDIVGEHTVAFFGEGERIELGHKATDRALFARGALRAALWVKDQDYGLYSMRDVLGL